MIRRLVVCCCVTLALAFSARADTIYVNVGGGGDFASIGEGISAASNGDTVLVAPGIYAGPHNVGIDFAGKNLRLLAVEGPEATTINAAPGDTAAILVHTGEDTTSLIQGFTITGAYVGVLAENASPVIDNCVFRDPLYAAVHCVSSAAKIRCSEFLWPYPGTDSASGVRCDGYASPQVRHCTFTTYGCAIRGDEGSNVLIRDCQFLSCVDDMMGGAGAYMSGGSITIEDCVFHGCYTDNPMHSVGVVIRTWAADVTLRRVQFTENGTPWWDPIELHLLYILDYEWEIENLLMDEVVFWGNDTRWSMVASNVDSVVIRRSTLADNEVWWEYPLIELPGSDTSIEESIIAHNMCSGVFEAPEAVTRHSCVYGNSAGDSLGGSHYENVFTPPLFCDLNGGDLGLHDDSPCLPTGNPWGVSMGAFGAGGCGTGIDGVPVDEAGAHILWVRPNPPKVTGTRIGLTGIPGSGAEVRVFDLRGRLVRQLRVDGSSSGRGECVWDLEDGQGRRVASGVYFIELSCKGDVVDHASVVVVR